MVPVADIFVVVVINLLAVLWFSRLGGCLDAESL